ncbi:helix-turn-helix domain-containing protein [Carboxylicivirga sp. A043]|uniref:helix-turn-helix domain-containing protein n=1 Tax=Carboxylicivirga litoralis TaxID=2816963 RepID=UPI0021CB7FB9|nr:helix-turn-helix domain-containing protein [Carboxylicivirga sp. A043]MCU4155579.1 helix-turn-helix domain-containing protein [Carboxylicivirga sp. A043]
MEPHQSMDEQFISKVHEIIEQNIDNEDFSVEKLATNVGLSRSMLHRKLIKVSGKNASETITEIRLLKAKQLLESNCTTVSETAYKVGYKTPSYFNRVFKQHYHVSPGDVKRHAQEHPFIKSKFKLQSNNAPRPKKLLYITFLSLIILGLFVISFYVFNPTIKPKSIAVLPLENLTGDTNNDYIINGIHDALIGELGRLSSLRVISRKSTLHYQERNMLLQDIASELDVDNIIEGSVVSSGDSIHLIIQAIKVFPHERHLMATKYQDKLGNILHLQSNVAKDIAKTIKARISDKELQQMTQTRQVNPEVYRSYLRGIYALHQGNHKWLKEGIQHMQNAIRIDPGDPLAYAGLALGYATMGHGQLDAETSFSRAVSAANKAIKLDPTIDESYTALSLLYLYSDWNWPLTKVSFENALEANPNNAIAHAHYAWYHFLFNDMEQCIKHAKQATLLDPLYPAYHAWLGLLYCNNNQYDEAVNAAKKALALNENTSYAHLVLGWNFIHNNQFQQAIEVFEGLPQTMQWDMHRVYCYTQCGQKEKALAIWNHYLEKAKTQNINDCYNGMMAACLGYNDVAFECFNKAIDKKTYPITYINYNPASQSIRNDARYTRLLQRMNLLKK